MTSLAIKNMQKQLQKQLQQWKDGLRSAASRGRGDGNQTDPSRRHHPRSVSPSSNTVKAVGWAAILGIILHGIGEGWPIIFAF